MSTNGLERLLYDLGTSGRTRAAYFGQREAFLERYPLDEAEKRLVLDEDVAALFDRGVNPMVLVGFYTGLHGPGSMGDYLRKVPTLESRLAREGGR